MSCFSTVEDDQEARRAKHGEVVRLLEDLREGVLSGEVFRKLAEEELKESERSSETITEEGMC
jgi:hypothetical protein